MNPFLTPSEICELTGRKRRREQVAVLASMGIACVEKPEGKLLVLRERLEALLRSNEENQQRTS
jgi:hypothetical protein